MTMTNAELENEIKALKTQLTALQGTVGAKADATVVNALNSRVTNAEGNITTQGSAITTLNNEVSAIKTRVTALINKNSVPKGTEFLYRVKLGTKYCGNSTSTS